VCRAIKWNPRHLIGMLPDILLRCRASPLPVVLLEPPFKGVYEHVALAQPFGGANLLQPIGEPVGHPHTGGVERRVSGFSPAWLGEEGQGHVARRSSSSAARFNKSALFDYTLTTFVVRADTSFCAVNRNSLFIRLSQGEVANRAALYPPEAPASVKVNGGVSEDDVRRRGGSRG
jgi:hypothetical protein